MTYCFNRKGNLYRKTLLGPQIIKSLKTPFPPGTTDLDWKQLSTGGISHLPCPEKVPWMKLGFKTLSSDPFTYRRKETRHSYMPPILKYLCNTCWEMENEFIDICLWKEQVKESPSGFSLHTLVLKINLVIEH